MYRTEGGKIIFTHRVSDFLIKPLHPSLVVSFCTTIVHVCRQIHLYFIISLLSISEVYILSSPLQEQYWLSGVLEYDVASFLFIQSQMSNRLSNLHLKISFEIDSVWENIDRPTQPT